MNIIRSSIKRLTYMTGLALMLGSLVAACGSADDMLGAMDTGQDENLGTVVLLLTDDPTDEFSEVNVTINEISLIPNEGPPVTISSTGDAHQVNLLALEEVDDLFKVSDQVPAGMYHKIRLRVSNPTFMTHTGEEINGSEIDLVAGGKVDLLFDHPIRVLGGETLILRLDLDAQKSIFIHPASTHKYMMRPVVFVSVLDDILPRFVHVRGEILSINEEEQSFILRHPHRIQHLEVEESEMSVIMNSDPGSVEKPNVEGLDKDDAMHDRRHLLRVVVTDDTHIFDEMGQRGYFSSLAVGQKVMVRGVIRFGDGIHLQARVIKIGKMLRLHGVITRNIDDSHQFLFIPAPRQGIIGDMTVQVHDRTLILDARTHEPLDPKVLVRGKRIMISGVLNLEGPVFHAAVIVVKPDEPLPTRLQGIIQDIDLFERTFILSSNMSSDLKPDPLVRVMPDTVILKIHEDENGFLIEPIQFWMLMDGQEVHVFGYFKEAESLFHAKVIVVQSSSAS
jgi:hypothetical protein